MSAPSDFFKSLRYVDPTGSGMPIFCPVELESEPLKWLKYLLLVRLSLRSMDELTRSVHRFPLGRIEDARSSCAQVVAEASAVRAEVLVVLKLINRERAGQFINYRVQNAGDIAPVFQSIRSDLRPEHRELWLCRSAVGACASNYGGRVCLHAGENYAPSCMEIVWYTSPRLIENLKLEDFPYPYLRAYRLPGRLRYEVERFYLPTTAGPRTRGYLLADFEGVQSRLAARAEEIERLVLVLAGAGAREISLEFKSDEGRFSFIDWDTEVETAGLSQLILLTGG